MPAAGQPFIVSRTCVLRCPTSVGVRALRRIMARAKRSAQRTFLRSSWQRHVMSRPYPRDLKGHGRQRPQARWPGGARVALQFVLNYEEGGENCILHGDPASEAFLSDIPGAAPFPGMRHMNMESIYEYGSRVGFSRLLKMFDDRQWKFTSFAIASAIERYPEAAIAMRESGHELACHGWKWIDYTHVSIDIEREHIR